MLEDRDARTNNAASQEQVKTSTVVSASNSGVAVALLSSEKRCNCCHDIPSPRPQFKAFAVRSSRNKGNTYFSDFGNSTSFSR